MSSKLDNLTNAALGKMADNSDSGKKYLRPQLTLLVLRALLFVGIFAAVTFGLFVVKVLLGKFGMQDMLSFLSTELATALLFGVFLVIVTVSALCTAREVQDKLIADRGGNLDGGRYKRKLTISWIISLAIALIGAAVIVVLDALYASYGSKEGVQDFFTMDLLGVMAAAIAPLFYPFIYFIRSAAIVKAYSKDTCPICNRADYRVIMAYGDSRPHSARPSYYLSDRRHIAYGKFLMERNGVPALKEGECITFCKYCSLYVRGNAEGVGEVSEEVFVPEENTEKEDA